jgi:Alpha-L-fucosidase
MSIVSTCRGVAFFGPISMLLIIGIVRAASNVPPEPALRVPQTEMGITQLPNEKLDWFLDAKFGMFIHWGLYSGARAGRVGHGTRGDPAGEISSVCISRKR